MIPCGDLLAFMVQNPNDDNLRYVLFDELKLFMSQWDIPWFLAGDFNVVRSPYEKVIRSQAIFSYVGVF